MTDCNKNALFRFTLPPCLRAATQRLSVEITRGKSKGETTEVCVCEPCVGFVSRSIGLRVARQTEIEPGE